MQIETYRGLLARMSASTVTRTQASFAALNEAIKQRAENDQGSSGGGMPH